VESAKAKCRSQANFTKVSADLKRMEQLIAKDEIYRQQYDSAVAANNFRAAANLDSMLANVASAARQGSSGAAQASGAIQCRSRSGNAFTRRSGNADVRSSRRQWGKPN